MNVSINGNPMFMVSSRFNDIDPVHLVPHSGIDLVLKEGTPILSPAQGVVSRIMDFGNDNIGRGVAIKLNNGNEIIFGHLSKIDVRKGDIVALGQKIAESGNTGNSTGAHLHIGLKDSSGVFIDPSIYEKNFQKLYSQHAGYMDKLTDGSIYKTTAKTKAQLLQQDDGFFATFREFKQFLHDVRTEGWWYGFTGKHFSEWAGSMFKDIGVFILENCDLFILAPTILFMVATFFVGRNKYTKFIIPGFFAYFVCRYYYYVISGG